MSSINNHAPSLLDSPNNEEQQKRTSPSIDYASTAPLLISSPCAASEDSSASSSSDDASLKPPLSVDISNASSGYVPLELSSPVIITSNNSNDKFSLPYHHHHHYLYSQGLHCMLESVNNWFFPPGLPRSCQLFRKENLAVPASYLLVGLLQGLMAPFVNVYPLDLNATEAQQATVSALRGLPASLKLVFGFMSDNYPLLGYRRKSYMFIGWALSSFSMLALVFFSDLRMVKQFDNDTGKTVSIANENAPSIGFLSFCVLMSGIGYWLADVMADSVVAEKAKLEPEESRGQLQSSCYSFRFFGLMIAAPCSTIIYSTYGPQAVVFLSAILPLTILPITYYLWEPHNMEIKSVRAQCDEIWKSVCSRAVWQPMGFVYIYNVLQVGNAAWREFLRSVLGFTANQLNTLLIVAYVLLYLGVLAYKYYFITWSWRTIYISTTLLNGFLSALQVLLITGITFGLSPFIFALGDDVFADFISGIQFLPTTIMMVHLCPTGSEGASYAMFTTVHNAAGTLSGAISTLLLGIWDVSKQALVSGDYSGIMKLTILTTCIQTCGVFFCGLLPANKDELITLNNNTNGDNRYSTSKVGGVIFLSVTFLSIAYAIFVGVRNIIAPGWSGES